jgi:hypothetical protein
MKLYIQLWHGRCCAEVTVGYFKVEDWEWARLWRTKMVATGLLGLGFSLPLHQSSLTFALYYNYEGAVSNRAPLFMQVQSPTSS